MAARRPTRAAPVRHTHDVRILVADDEEAVRAAVRRALTLAGYEVELASDGDEALAMLAERAPDAVLLDVMMPGGTASRCVAACAQPGTPRPS